MSLWPPWVCKTDTRSLARLSQYSSQNSNYSINAHFSTVITNFLLINTSQIPVACNNTSLLQMQWHENNQSLHMNFSGKALLRSTVKCATWHMCPTWTQTAITEFRTCYQPEHQVSQLSCEKQKGISLPERDGYPRKQRETKEAMGLPWEKQDQIILPPVGGGWS